MLTKANILTFFGNTALAGSGGGGAMLALKWLGENSSGIGALFVIIVGVAGIILRIKGHKETIRHNRAKEAALKKSKD